MVREVRVQAQEAAVAGAIPAGDRVPHGRRLATRHAQISFAAELERGGPHVDRDALRTTRAQLPELRGGEPRGGDRNLRRGSDPEGRGQRRVGARERYAFERLRIAARE